MTVPATRITRCNARMVAPGGGFVLYWMVAARRANHNFALQRAVEQARALGKGLVVLETLRCNYPHAADRFHAFLIDGMADNALAFGRCRVRYLPYVEPQPDAARGLVETLAAGASLVVSDDTPVPHLRHLVDAVAGKLPVAVEKVDSNGILPLAASERVFGSAHDFRRAAQKILAAHLTEGPLADPFDGVLLKPVPLLPPEIAQRWPVAEVSKLAADHGRLRALPIDHSVAPVETRGGRRAARQALKAFLETRLERYEEGRNHPDDEATSGLSPYLACGHISVHEVLGELARREGWSVDRVSASGDGSREGWWGLTPAAEAFLDELVIWRELGYNFAAKREDARQFDALPGWARTTLAAHAADPREHTYSIEQLQAGQTHDEVWNSAQRQLVREGKVHGYLRMLWGKKILEWSSTPQEALGRMLHLNDRWALDGSNPNSTSGITWCLGRYDRPWAPERPIYGTVRYMSSSAAIKKLRLKEYLRRNSG
jgi:deoxyribodipyrimidine photo-lyase